MKHFIFTLGLFIICRPVMGQNCNPDTSKHVPGVYPEGGKIDTVWVGKNYTKTVTYFSQKDTTIKVIISPYPEISVNAHIDSIAITNWNNPAGMNLPPGLTALCNTANCVFPGNSRNCVKLSGMVTKESDTGSYTTHLTVKYFVTINSAPLNGVNYAFNGDFYPFKLTVKKGSPINSLRDEEWLNLSVGPNPCADKIVLKNIPENAPFQFNLINMQGKLVYSKYLNPGNGELELECDLPSGIYTLQIQSSGQRVAYFKIVKL
jgi:hypothetical protein